MTYKSWEDIYQMKSSKDLFKIYKGYQVLTAYQKELAYKVLSERKFDFQEGENQLAKDYQAKQRRKIVLRKKNRIAFFMYDNLGLIIAVGFTCLYLLLHYQIGKANPSFIRGEVAYSLYYVRLGLWIGIVFGVAHQLIFLYKRLVMKNRNGMVS